MIDPYMAAIRRRNGESLLRQPQRYTTEELAAWQDALDADTARQVRAWCYAIKRKVLRARRDQQPGIVELEILRCLMEWLC